MRQLVMIPTAIDQSVVVLSVGSASVVGALELDGADARRLTVSTVAHGHLAERTDGGGEKFLSSIEEVIGSEAGGRDGVRNDRETLDVHS